MTRMRASTWSPPSADETDFSFTPENAERVRLAVARYPEGRAASAVLWTLYVAQEQNGGWLSAAAIRHTAEVLEMAPIRVAEVANFYSMFNLRDKGQWRIQVCRTTGCWIAGSDAITAACLAAAEVSAEGEVSPDGLVSVEEVECLGACCNAPVMQLNDGAYYEDLTPARATEIIRALRAGEAPPAGGSQTGRLASAPEGWSSGDAAVKESTERNGEKSTEKEGDTP